MDEQIRMNEKNDDAIPLFETKTDLIDAPVPGYKLSKPHSVISGFFDYYILSVTIGAVTAIISFLLSKPYLIPHDFVFLYYIFSNLIPLACVLAYYLSISKKVLWLSPGELISSRIIVNRRKVWANPYYANRWFLFSLFLISLIIQGNTWDGVGAGVSFSLTVIISKIIKIILTVLCIISFGKGKTAGGLGIAVFYIIGAFQAYIYISSPAYAITFMMYGIFVILYIIALIVYHLIRKKHLAKRFQ